VTRLADVLRYINGHIDSLYHISILTSRSSSSEWNLNYAEDGDVGALETSHDLYLIKKVFENWQQSDVSSVTGKHQSGHCRSRPEAAESGDVLALRLAKANIKRRKRLAGWKINPDSTDHRPPPPDLVVKSEDGDETTQDGDMERVPTIPVTAYSSATFECPLCHATLDGPRMRLSGQWK
jgi:hypothetical protein